ncbi:MAG: hypothetical protein A2508_10135 [Candidatus Lambdaproteobacteria bacterium RIFOXYD12_FULL_49_8]|uniref:HPP transmembrane region domain-containing protein n=1 Tax=Candidatus Lambdaproteobacteria bacterium RIFOXYD2_FULL_50_16 TaxID=1817772 RepID=A0A1F6GBI7_9PROT|nr:MAG: hypothetical protein A2527_04880 [Candidatus Lambdaproteobacteria bacterium RIFOXYD2_FULL_50_16]OGG97897.1 MAG: hypothetical protein A2508_10135 [Candidatus Lambdaproteobacteria bacterium RIFOXYD12_FULL_49_8]
MIKAYFAKMAGKGQSAPLTPPAEIYWSWLGSFLGISAVAGLHYFWAAPQDLVMIIGSFGASAVLVYGAISSPLAQPRNLIGGHFLSALVGVACFQFFGDMPVLAGALAVSLAIVLMQLTITLHPPGGATALIAVIGSDNLHNLGYFYALIPALSGALVMLVVALLVNNLAPTRKYPMYWL